MELVDMFSKDRDDFLHNLKQDFSEGIAANLHGEYKTLIDEWKESARILPMKNQTTFSEGNRDLNVFKRVSEFTKYKLAYLDTYTRSRESALAALGCVIIYLDSELAAFRVAGDSALRDELRSKGIHHGSSFKRNLVGVCVANQARTAKGQTLCRIGEENYLDVLAEYACFARYEEESFRNFWGVNVVILPKKNYSRVVKAQILQILNMLDISNQVIYPCRENMLDLLSSYTYGVDDMIILIDNNGYVSFVTEAFEKCFGKAANKWPQVNIHSFLPELEFVMQYLKDGISRVTREILLTEAAGRARFYVIDFLLLKKDDKQIGIKCSFVPAEPKKRNLNKGYGQKTRYDFNSIKGKDPKLLEIKRIGFAAAESTSNVLIYGESGTGKELVAQAIHDASSEKRKGAFVPINCAAISPDLITSELFGYEDGAFTGAVKGGKAGKFEQADGGTVFLDEISEMPLNMQSSLLRVLEDGVISRVGGNRYISLNIRVIAATNKDLWSCVQAGTFRADLFFRLNIIKICIPPLRERQGDIELMMKHFIELFAQKGNCSIKNVDRQVVRIFESYSWPGNVRELRNVIERCANSYNGGTLTPSNLPVDLLELVSNSSPSIAEAADMPHRAEAATDSIKWQKYDRQKIAALMEMYNGNKSKIAKEMGISRGTLYKKLREFGFEE